MLSVADAVNANDAPVGPVASTVAFAGTVTMGRVVSVTVTTNEAVPVLPCASVALQLTVVAPNGKVDPLTGVQLAASGPSTLSVAEAANAYGAPSGPVASSVAPTGAVTTGGVTSIRFTVTVKLCVVRFPARSLVEHSIVVVPTGNREPLSGEQITDCSFST